MNNFQMTKNNYKFAIPTSSDCFRTFAPGFSTNREQNKTNRALHARFFPRLEQITSNFDWFLALFAPVMIGRSNDCFVLVFQQSFENRSKHSDWLRNIAPHF